MSEHNYGTGGGFFPNHVTGSRGGETLAVEMVAHPDRRAALLLGVTMDGLRVDEGQRWRERSEQELTVLLRDSLFGADGTLARHIDLDVGGCDELDLEPVLFQLLGVTSSVHMLLGVSWVSTGDLDACRAEWGEPAYHVDLRTGTDSPLCWEIWTLPGAVVLDESIVGGSIVMPADAPRWVLYTEPTANAPMLFPGGPCPAH